MNHLPHDPSGYAELSGSAIGRYWPDFWEIEWVARPQPGLLDLRAHRRYSSDVKERIARSYHLLCFC